MKKGKIVWICVIVLVAFVGIALLSSNTRASEFDANVAGILQQPLSSEIYDKFVSLDTEYQNIGPVVALFIDDVQYEALKEKISSELNEYAITLTEQIDALVPVDTLASYDEYSDYWDNADELKLGETAFETSVRPLVENYDKIAEYQSDLDDLLKTYKVNCTECGGRGSISCSSCHGSGSKSCSSCNGRGSKLVTWYSEGDWGEKTYTSYDCTSCNGRGKKSCSSCNGGSRDCDDCNGGFNYVFS